MTAIESLTIADLLEGFEKKEFSSEEIVSAYLDRAEQFTGLGAYVSLFSDSAREKAREADNARTRGEKKPLLGVPIAVKDAFTLQEGTTTCASNILSNYYSPYTAACIQNLIDDGAVILGKTNMDEFAMGSSNESSAFGPARNPWDAKLVPGGSSGGSAVAVSASLAPGAIGTDTGGSIRQPSAFCGTTGLKPTYGRISRFGLVAYASSLDQAGPVALNVQDCSLLAHSLSGYDHRDSTSVDRPVPAFQEECQGSIEGLRIGVPREYFVEGLNQEIEESVRAALSQMEALGAELVEISLPHTEYAIPTYYIVACAEASSNLSRYDGIRYGLSVRDGGTLEEVYSKTRSQGFGTEVKRRILMGTFVLSSGYYDAYYRKAQKVRALIQKDFSDAFADKCDCIVSPTTPTTAFALGSKIDDPIAMYLNDVLTVSVNLAGIPAMSIPCGFDSKNLPIGLQIMAAPWEESTLFRLGAAYQRETSWHEARPKEAEGWNTKA